MGRQAYLASSLVVLDFNRLGTIVYVVVFKKVYRNIFVILGLVLLSLEVDQMPSDIQLSEGI